MWFNERSPKRPIKMLGVSKTNKILNVAIDSPGQSSGWIIGAESPLEESFTDKFFTLQKSSMDSESNRVSNLIEDYESKTLLLHILREKQAECSKDEFESIGNLCICLNLIMKYLIELNAYGLN